MFRVDPRPAAVAVTPLSRQASCELELSYAQQRLWFLDQLVPGNPFYNVSSGRRVRGRLEVWALREAMGRVVQRQEALRTRYPNEGGRPVLVLEESAEVVLEERDLRGCGEEEARRRAGEEAGRPFDLGLGPL